VFKIKKAILFRDSKKNTDIESLRYEALRLNPNVKFTDAFMVISGASRAFLKLILKGCAEWAEAKSYAFITEKEMNEMNAERKSKKKIKNEGNKYVKIQSKYTNKNPRRDRINDAFF